MVQTSIIPSGPTETDMTQEEQEEFLEKRCEALRKHMPMTPEEFEDTVDESKWQWGRHLLPYIDWGRSRKAQLKKRTIMKQREFFDQFRLFKPLAMKYPTLVRKLIVRDHPNIENTDMKINVEWIANEEKVAGFSYEDFANETDGMTFTNWSLPQKADIVPGKIVSMIKDGAFVEIGAKTWAFLPLKNISLAPIASPAEKLAIGDEIEAKVVSTDGESLIPGDPRANTMILSMTDLQRVSAWDEIEDRLRTGTGTADPFMEVLVTQMRPWGALVQTESGLEGIIPSSQLADKAGDVSIVGQKILVEIFYAKRELAEVKAERISDYALGFTYKNVATKALAGRLIEGSVVDAKIVNIRDLSFDVEVEDTLVQVRKVDVTALVKTFSLLDLFEEGEMIKCYVADLMGGAIRLSLRALEFKRGMMLTDKAAVFARAEETAKTYRKKSDQQKEKFQAELQSVMGDDDLSAPGTEGKKSSSPGTLDFDAGEDAIF